MADEQVDPVERYLRNLHTTDEVRAAAYDAVYDSDDEAEIQERLTNVRGLTDRLRAEIWDARFGVTQEEQEVAEKEDRAAKADLIPIERRTLKQAADAAPLMLESWAKTVGPTAVAGAAGTLTAPLVRPILGAAGKALDTAAAGAVAGGLGTLVTGETNPAIVAKNAIYGGMGGWGIGAATRGLGRMMGRADAVKAAAVAKAAKEAEKAQARAARVAERAALQATRTTERAQAQAAKEALRAAKVANRPTPAPNIAKGMASVGKPRYDDLVANERMIEGMSKATLPTPPPPNAGGRLVQSTPLPSVEDELNTVLQRGLRKEVVDLAPAHPSGGGFTVPALSPNAGGKLVRSRPVSDFAKDIAKPKPVEKVEIPDPGAPSVTMSPKAKSIATGRGVSGIEIETDKAREELIKRAMRTAPGAKNLRAAERDKIADEIVTELRQRRTHGTAGFKQLPELPEGELKRIQDAMNRIMKRRAE